MAALAKHFQDFVYICVVPNQYTLSHEHKNMSIPWKERLWYRCWIIASNVSLYTADPTTASCIARYLQPPAWLWAIRWRCYWPTYKCCIVGCRRSVCWQPLPKHGARHLKSTHANHFCHVHKVFLYDKTHFKDTYEHFVILRAGSDILNITLHHYYLNACTFYFVNKKSTDWN